MLTADLVSARRYKGELRLLRLEGEARLRAEELAEGYLALAKDHEGRTREELEAAWATLDGDEEKRRLAGSIRKLVEDACEFQGEPTVSPVELRRDLFLRASAARRELPDGAPFPRGAVLAETAAALALPETEVERLLFADTRGAEVLVRAPNLTGATLVGSYDLAQAQAVLLRAVRVVCEVRAATAGAVRAFFARLKFHRLLYVAERMDDGGFRIVIDGPFSLFESVTRYGLKLALLLGSLQNLDGWTLEAEVRWGKDRTPLRFRCAGEGTAAPGAEQEDGLPDDVRALVEAIRVADTEWKVEPVTTLLDVPGGGVAIPDVAFRRKGTAAPVYLEVLGYWSRDAVWKRVELASRGLEAKVLFAVSSRLRVSEDVLDEDSSAALYVYKGVMNPRAVLARIEALAERAPPPR